VVGFSKILFVYLSGEILLGSSFKNRMFEKLQRLYRKILGKMQDRASWPL